MRSKLKDLLDSYLAYMVEDDIKLKTKTMYDYKEEIVALSIMPLIMFVASIILTIRLRSFYEPDFFLCILAILLYVILDLLTLLIAIRFFEKRKTVKKSKKDIPYGYIPGGFIVAFYVAIYIFNEINNQNYTLILLLFFTSMAALSNIVLLILKYRYYSARVKAGELMIRLK
ncbi:hypothetical protein [Dehalococcoides mccartyi]|uniref:hypothetical protein n=1 Tax=Dehalococcoides mccartyi TaxID=61435 RepID=UPI001F15D0C6|nr:hypothetical protein [Dehalococcoides mccartyi]